MSLIVSLGENTEEKIENYNKMEKTKKFFHTLSLFYIGFTTILILLFMIFAVSSAGPLLRFLFGVFLAAVSGVASYYYVKLYAIGVAWGYHWLRCKGISPTKALDMLDWLGNTDDDNKALVNAYLIGGRTFAEKEATFQGLRNIIVMIAAFMYTSFVLTVGFWMGWINAFANRKDSKEIRMLLKEREAPC